ncbi:MAG TPA: hypothetical protein VGL47_40730 [Amycolatopsis sp.]|uniref:hypothetical protein n=1 Tax=Amycolatopsis sp. TaxID=37632 RepID=UPI002F42E1B3
MIVRIRGYALPSGEYTDLYADGDRWTTDPVPGASLVGEGWLVPGPLARQAGGADQRDPASTCWRSSAGSIGSPGDTAPGCVCASTRGTVAGAARAVLRRLGPPRRPR